MFFYTQPIYLCIYLVTEHLIYKKHAKAIINHTLVTKQLPQQLTKNPQTSCSNAGVLGTVSETSQIKLIESPLFFNAQQRFGGGKQRIGKLDTGVIWKVYSTMDEKEQ